MVNEANSWLLAVCGLCFVSLSSGAKAVALDRDNTALSEQEQQYRTLIDQAVDNFRRGLWAEAGVLFQRAHTLQPNARTLRGMGVCAFEVGNYVEALQHLRASLSDTRQPLPAEQRAEVTTWIAQAEGFVAQLRVVIVPEHATVRVGDQPVSLGTDRTLTLTPGAYDLGFSAPHFIPELRHVVARAGQHDALSVQLQPERRMPDASDKHKMFLRAGWGLLGGAVAVGIPAIALWKKGRNEVREVKESCRFPCTQEEANAEFSKTHIHAYETFATVSWVVAGTALATAGVMFALPLREKREKKAPTARLELGPTSVRLAAQY